MSYGFRIYDNSGRLLISELDLSMLILDVLEVDPTTSGSVVYQTNGTVISTTQTQKEPATLDRTNIGSFNAVNTSLVVSGNTTTLSWTPRFQIGTKYNVLIYVLGFKTV